MRGGRQETNEYIFQIVLSTSKKHGGRQSVSESYYIRKVVRSDANGNLLDVSREVSGKIFVLSKG